MRRRDFITLLGGVVAWPLVAHAQQSERVRRIGVLWPFGETDPFGKAFMQGLAELGWTEGRNLRADVRWNVRTPEQAQTFIQQLIALQPDVLVTATPRLTLAIQRQTQTIPIVFVGAADPVTSGLVANLSHPGGNTTGVTDLFSSLAGKWLELLRECAPGLTRVARVVNPNTVNGALGSGATAAALAQAADQFGVTLTYIPARDSDEIARAIPAFAAEPGGALLVGPPPLLGPERKLLNGLAIRYGLPALYQDRSFVVEGGLLAYGADLTAMYRHDGPPYVDRVLRGAKPGDLPVQFPTKFTLSVNLTTARAMGLKIPESFLLRADALIE
jgi:putative ABC transport system substrate-binding protein